MKRERITESEALSAVRAGGGHDIGEVETLILESDGEFNHIDLGASAEYARTDTGRAITLSTMTH